MFVYVCVRACVSRCKQRLDSNTLLEHLAVDTRCAAGDAAAKSLLLPPAFSQSAQGRCEVDAKLFITLHPPPRPEQNGKQFHSLRFRRR